jgi:hypothetical protein
MREKKKARRGLIRKPEGSKLLGVFRRRWENTMKLELKEMVWRYELHTSVSE